MERMGVLEELLPELEFRWSRFVLNKPMSELYHRLVWVEEVKLRTAVHNEGEG